VECRPVHGERPKRAFGPVYASRRAPSYRAPYQPAILSIETRVPVCGAWMKRFAPM
jgi:hypothetical protein